MFFKIDISDQKNIIIRKTKIRTQKYKQFNRNH